MKIIIESTTKFVELQTAMSRVPARVWEGTTDKGVKVVAFITRIASPETENQEEFQRELEETPHTTPSPEVQAFPLRLIL